MTTTLFAHQNGGARVLIG